MQAKSSGGGFVVEEAFAIQGLVSEMELFLYSFNQTGSWFFNTIVCGSWERWVKAETEVEYFKFLWWWLVGEALHILTAQTCFHYLGDTTFVLLECLEVVNSGKSLINLGLEYYCLKYGGVISQWVAPIFVWKRNRMVGDKDAGNL